jgi:glycerol-3-phosphate dehydrogenase (NAD(P)+)
MRADSTHEEFEVGAPIGILSSRSWGVAAAQLLSENGHTVLLWDESRVIFEKLRDQRTHEFLPQNYKISSTVQLLNDPVEITKRCQTLICTTKANFLEPLLTRIAHVTHTDQIMLYTTRGFHPEHRMSISQLIPHMTRIRRTGYITGPALPIDIFNENLAAIVVASGYAEVGKHAQKLLQTPNLFVEGRADVQSIELASCMHTAVSFALGVSHATKLTRSGLGLCITKVVNDFTKIAEILGISVDAFLGVAGIGEIVAYGSSEDNVDYCLGCNAASDLPGARPHRGHAHEVLADMLVLSKRLGLHCHALEALVSIATGVAAGESAAREVVESLITH